MPRGRLRWLAALLISATGVTLVALADLTDADSATFLFWCGPLLVATSGGLYAWRGAVTSAAVPAILVLLFPEEGPEPPVDDGGCDPFCADPLAALDAALSVAAVGLALAVVGWLVAWPFIRTSETGTR